MNSAITDTPTVFSHRRVVHTDISVFAIVKFQRIQSVTATKNSLTWDALYPIVLKELLVKKN